MQGVLLLDFDECIADLDKKAAMKKLDKLLQIRIGEKSESIVEEFFQIYNSINHILHGRASTGMHRIKERLNEYKVVVPKGISREKITFMWSRELWLKYLSDKHDLGLGGKEIMKIIKDGFWMPIADASPIHDDAAQFLENADKKKIFVVTGSDRNLIFKGDLIIYDPKYSMKAKIKRIRRQGLTMLPEKHLITGDPYEKPSKEFWEKVIKISGVSSPSDCIYIDDSLPMVIEAINVGFKGFLLDRKKSHNKKDIKNKVYGYATRFDEPFFSKKLMK